MRTVDLESVVMVILPLVLVSFAWRWFIVKGVAELTKWRRMVLGCSLIAGTSSAILFLAMNVHALLIAEHFVGSSNAAKIYGHLAPLELSVAPVILGLFGKGTGRVLVTCSGILLAFVWLIYAAASA